MIFLYNSIIHKVHCAVQEEGFGIFTYIMELTHYLSYLSRNESLMPRVIWNDENCEELVIDGRRVTVTSFCALYHRLFEETETLLHQVLLGCEVPNFDGLDVVDNLSNTNPGYSFISDSRNPFSKYRKNLLIQILNPAHGDRFWFGELCGKQIVWNTGKDGITAWIKNCERCLANMFALLHYGAGQPGRGTELGTLTWVNSADRPRSVYWFHGVLNIVTTYNKTQATSERDRVICRSLPPPVGRLFIIWMALVIPALDAIWANLEPNLDPFKQSLFSQHLFAGRYGCFDTEDFSSILASISGQPVSEGGLGYAMNISTTRHFLIAIMREHLKGIPERSLLEEYFNEQSRHGEDAAEHYALSFSSIAGVISDRLAKFVKLSKLHHRLLYRDYSHSTVALPNQPSGPPPLSDPLDIAVLADKICRRLYSTSTFSSQMASHLAPGIYNCIAEAVALAIIQKSACGENAHLLPSKVTPSTSPPRVSHTAVGTVDVSTVEINPERWRELHGMMGDGALFKSPAQACLVELCARRENDVLAILGTGQGKSLAFMLNAFRRGEVGMATIVVVPLLSLQQDLGWRMKEKGIRTLSWCARKRNISIDESIQVVLVVTETAASEAFINWMLKQSEQGRIARIAFDEAHCVVIESHYQPVLEALKPLRQARVQVVALTATAPSSAVWGYYLLQHKLFAHLLYGRRSATPSSPWPTKTREYTKQ